MEEWKLINGYDYSVSSLGRIRNNRTGRILKGVPNTFGYLQVFLYKNGRSKRFTVHQLVASYFLPDQMGKEINHINEISWILEWRIWNTLLIKRIVIMEIQ